MLFDNALSKHLIFKRISCLQSCFGLFTKIKKGFQCHTLFLSQDIKQNVLLRSYLDS